MPQYICPNKACNPLYPLVGNVKLKVKYYAENVKGEDIWKCSHKGCNYSGKFGFDLANLTGSERADWYVDGEDNPPRCMGCGSVMTRPKRRYYECPKCRYTI